MLVNQDSGVSTPSEGSKKTEFTVLNMAAPSPAADARKERVFAWAQEGHCHELCSSLFLKMEGRSFIFLPIGGEEEEEEL